LVAVVALAAFVPVGFALPALALSGAAALVVVLLAIVDSLIYRSALLLRKGPPRERPTLFSRVLGR
jgi:hypothetical protein